MKSLKYKHQNFDVPSLTRHGLQHPKETNPAMRDFGVIAYFVFKLIIDYLSMEIQTFLDVSTQTDK